MKKLSKMGEKGFTLIELMIVVAIIGILAAIAIPRFAQMLEKAREGSTKGNIGALKSAISIYYGDREGIWPNDIDLNVSISTKAFSNYMGSIPPVKVTCPWDTVAPRPHLGNYLGKDVTATGAANATGPIVNGSGWLYNSTDGEMWVNSIKLDSKGAAYSNYAHE